MSVTSDIQASYPQNTPLTINFSVSGGRTPYAASLFTGSLPPGLTLNGLQIQGTPTTTGTWQLSIRISDLVDTVKPLYIKVRVV